MPAIDVVDQGPSPGGDSPAVSTGVVARGVRRTFGDVVAVDSMDLDAPPGHVTALVGPNGAGKTTLLLVLASLLTPDSGQLTVGGYDPVSRAADVRARMGWMPDAFGSYDTLTAREVLEFVAAAYRIPKQRGEERSRELLALVHLADYADRPVHVLSRGQKQRLGLVRALVHDPAVLLLDEPAAGLDPRSRIELRGLLRNLAAEGRAVLVSSHVLAELEETADRVVFVDRGRTVDEHRLADLRPVQRRPWRLRALDQETLLAGVNRLGAVLAGEPGPSGVDVMLASDEEAADLVAALVRDGVRIVACSPASGTLEAAYLAMTQDRR
jgi:ABC-2 type transport system ATP-binding protein